MILNEMLSQLNIRTTKGVIEPFRLNWAQKEMMAAYERQYTAGKPVRLMVLKARRLGMSTLSEALMFLWGFMHHGHYGLILAHETDASEYLLNIARLYWDTWPFNRLYNTRYISRKELEWLETASHLRISTAGNKSASRGRTINALHASEVAFWDEPEETMLALRPAVTNVHPSMVILESTANGIGNWWHSMWEEAQDADSEYEPLFFPWWKHPDYVAAAVSYTRPLVNMDEDERLLKKLGADDEHLKWRRWALRNLAGGDLNMFQQEYPSTPDEAFVSSGSNVFPISMLKEAYDPSRESTRGFLVRNGSHVNFQPDPSGPLTVFGAPAANRAVGKYFVGGDPSRTTMGDNACAQVINSITYEQVAIWHGKTDPMSFAEELAKLGTYYNDAMLAPEIEGPGYATIGRLVELDYPHIWQNRWADKYANTVGSTLGWSTTWKRKEWAIGFLIKLLVDGDLLIHDSTTFKEMTNYVTLPSGGYGNSEGEGRGYDDTVMALAIACICSATEGGRHLHERSIEQPGMWQEDDDDPPWQQWGDVG